jgi:pimeloyl-ACP methyl ester carboxylesterase
MRKLFSIAFSAILLLSLSSQGTGANGAFPSGTITHSDRTVLHDDIVHYRFDVRVGPGQFDVIRLHRVVKEPQPHHPIRTVDGVLLLPGQPNSFEAIFMAPLISSVPAWDRSIAIFLAENNIDAWGMDYGWALVPAETTDFDFMKGWGVEKDTRHAEVALSLARQIRGITDQGFDPLHVLGFSYGGIIAYSLAGEETQQSHLLRNVKGIVVGDVALKFKEKSLRDYYCSDIAQYQSMLEAGVYNDDTGVFLKQVSDLALSSPDDGSPIVPGFTNYQLALVFGASTGLLNGQFWHFVGGYLDANEIPSDLRFTEARLWLDLLQNLPPHCTVQADFDVDATFCGKPNVPFDDHLGEISVPILFLGTGGGFGETGYYTTTLTASKDVTKFTVSITGDRATDFGHADLFLSKDAEGLAWRPILNWLKAHR